jgi:pimeloyl-ACP methyl ester carboxylesterase
LICAIAVSITIMLGGCSSFRAVDALRVLADLSSASGEGRLEPQTREVLREPIAYNVAGHQRQGDLYRPVEDAKIGLVLVPGAARAGRDDPRLVAFANTLARARFMVLVPEIENLRHLKVSAEDADDIADAVQYLARRTGSEQACPVGVVAISYAAGPAILAALRPENGARVRFVLAIGGYYDMTATVTFFTTGFFRERKDQPWRYRTPNVYGKWVFARSNADRLSTPHDRAAVAEMAQRKMRDPRANVDDQVQSFGPEAQAVHALLVNRDPDAVPALVAALPARIRAETAALDLKRRDLKQLSARLILIHGRDDAIIPYSESEALAAAAAPGRAALHLVDGLAHVDLGPGVLFDVLTLWRATYQVLAERDSAAAACKISPSN